MRNATAAVAANSVSGKNGNGQDKNPSVTALKPVPSPEVIPGIKPAAIESTLDDRIHRVETLSGLISKRAKLLETKRKLDKFQVSANDFSCNMVISDADGNQFTTAFAPGIRRVIEMMKTSYEESIKEVESQINF